MTVVFLLLFLVIRRTYGAYWKFKDFLLGKISRSWKNCHLITWLMYARSQVCCCSNLYFVDYQFRKPGYKQCIYCRHINQGIIGVCLQWCIVISISHLLYLCKYRSRVIGLENLSYRSCRLAWEKKMESALATDPFSKTNLSTQDKNGYSSYYCEPVAFFWHLRQTAKLNAASIGIEPDLCVAANVISESLILHRKHLIDRLIHSLFWPDNCTPGYPDFTFDKKAHPSSSLWTQVKIDWHANKSVTPYIMLTSWAQIKFRFEDSFRDYCYYTSVCVNAMDQR